MNYTVNIPEELADGSIRLRFDQPLSDLDFMDFCKTSVQGSGPVGGFELVLSRIWG